MFDLKILCDKKILGPKNNVAPKIFLAKTISGPKMFGPK